MEQTTATETVPETDPLRERERIVRIHLRRRETGQGALDLYRVPVHVPFSRTVIEDCALYLGRLYLDLPSDELDVDRTLESTLTAGRPCPIFAPARAPRELLVLHDVEAGAPPFLSGFLRLLDALVRLGVRLRRHAFARNPDHLADHPGWDLAALGHRHPGAALLLFSRLRGRDLGRLGWLRHLSLFHRCAWLDPVPEAPSRRRSAGRRVGARGLASRRGAPCSLHPAGPLLPGPLPRHWRARHGAHFAAA